MVQSSSIIDPKARLGKKVKVWHFVQIREHASIGNNTTIGSYSYIGANVIIGNNVKIQVNAKIFKGVTIEDGVFIGPAVCFCNDKYPRAISPSGNLNGANDWEVLRTKVCYGASIGANATILPGIIIGKFSMVGAGTTVIRDVPDYRIVVGNPGTLIGYVCACGFPLRDSLSKKTVFCSRCNKHYIFSGDTLEEK